jgi:hypothetical protein
MGWKTGFEPATPGITIRCSNQLSYIHHKSCETSTVRFVRSRPSRAPVTRLRAGRIFIVRVGAPGRNRTCNHRLRRPVLYPVELRARGAHDSQTDRSEHAAAGSARCGPKLVGVEGFEPPTSCSQSRRATRLRYTPPPSGDWGETSASSRPAIVRTSGPDVNAAYAIGNRYAWRFNRTTHTQEFPCAAAIRS